MPKESFSFKQFTIDQTNAAMKVGTDSVILASWVELKSGNKILDVGTGTGIIALCMAQRFDAHITAIELDESAFIDAKKNIESSIFSSKITPILDNFLTHHFAHTFDLIISNPPYFSNGIISPSNSRANARHEVNELPLAQLLAKSQKCLSTKGHIALILPTDRLSELRAQCLQNHLGMSKLCFIYTKPDAEPKRFMCIIEPILNMQPQIEVSELLLQDQDGEKTAAYKALTREFYL